MCNLNLRPRTLQEFIGKSNIKLNLQTYIDSALKRKTCLDHLLLHGLPGTGKTSIAFIIANVFNKKIKVIQGTQLKKVTDLINFISLVCEHDILFIDEIHAMSTECFETLYSILEDFCIDISIGREQNQKMTRVRIPQFTLIGATTNINKLPKPLEERFGIKFYFDLYTLDEMNIIAQHMQKIIGCDLNNDDLYTLCAHSKGVPRIIGNLLKRVNDFKIINSEISLNEILARLEIYYEGLQILDVKYLQTLHDNSDGLGLKTLSCLLELDTAEIENKIEPYLLRNGYILKTIRGRQLSAKGHAYIQKLRLNKN